MGDELLRLARAVVDAHRRIDAFYEREARGAPHESTESAMSLLEARDRAIEALAHGLGYPPVKRLRIRQGERSEG